MILITFKISKSRPRSILLYLFLFIVNVALLGCASQQNLQNKTGPEENIEIMEEPSPGDVANPNSSTPNSTLDDHLNIQAEDITPLPPKKRDSLSPASDSDLEKELSLVEIGIKELGITSYIEPESAVAKKILENYFTSKNREPGGHCLTVSKRRFEKAYLDVYGHSFYQDLPDSIVRSGYSRREVFDFLYYSTSGNHEGWRSLPEQYRGKGNAGAIAFAGMGTLVDWFGIWTGRLKPGSPMQVWKRSADYEKVVRGINYKGFDPFGHSFIFLGYIRDEDNKIVGIRIADQGYQSYRPLLPHDYEVWWAVNLSI